MVDRLKWGCRRRQTVFKLLTRYRYYINGERVKGEAGQALFSFVKFWVWVISIILTKPTQSLVLYSQETKHIDPRSISNSIKMIIFFQTHQGPGTNNNNKQRA